MVVTRRDMAGPRIDTVSNDDRAGAALAVEHLVGLGHRRIAHLSGGDNPTSVDRASGYLTAMSAVGLEEHAVVIEGRLTDAGGHAAATQALAAQPQPTALFVANDIAALGAVAAVQERGLSVPDDVSVVGYDGIRLGALRTISLTTVAQPLAEMGVVAARRLFSRIARPGERARHISVEAYLEVRGSSGPARSTVAGGLSGKRPGR